MDILVRNISLDEIPLMEVFNPDVKGKNPMVLLYHGYTGQKEFILSQAYLLASNGFFVVLPDAFGHGQRAEGGPIDLFTSILKTTEEVNKIIKFYDADDRVDNSRIGLSGYSMGGMITFAYISSPDNRVKAAVPIISTPDWVSIVKGFDNDEKIEELINLGIVEEGTDIEDFFKLAREIQPIGRYELMAKTPLLMLCGEDDDLTPASGALELTELLKPIFFDEDALEIKLYPGVGHGDTLEMNMAMLQWMEEYV